MLLMIEKIRAIFALIEKVIGLMEFRYIRLSENIDTSTNRL